MKPSMLLPWLIPAFLVAGVAMAGGDHLPPARHHPLPHSKCLNVRQINEWHVINATTITVRNGPRHYLIKTVNKCPRLGKYGSGLFFHSSPGSMGWRICGDIGETVSSRLQPPCAIQSVRLISKKQFKALDKKAEHKGSRAQPATASSQHH